MRPIRPHWLGLALLLALALVVSSSLVQRSYGALPSESSPSRSPAADDDPPASDPIDDPQPGTDFTLAPKETVCSPRRGVNTQVNQDCQHAVDDLSTVAGRGQSKNSPDIAAQPGRPQNLVASYTDYRSGDATCASSYSRDGGRSWKDTTLPIDYVDGEFVGKPREDYQASAATSAVWDSQGNSYLLCMAYNRGVADVSPNTDMSGGLYLFRSTGTGGSSWNFLPTPVAQNKLLEGGPEKFSILDSPRIVIDTNPRSKYRDRIYVFWMFQDANLTNYIFSAHSDDYGETFSQGQRIAADSDLCPMTYGLDDTAGRCNLSDNTAPFVGPDGTVYVAWSNRNGAQASEADNKNQVLLSSSADGGQTFGAPVKVGDSYELPDCDTYQGRGPSFGGIYNFSCMPEKGKGTSSVYRASNYVSAGINPKTAQIVVAYGSYINANSQGEACQPEGLSPESMRPLYAGVKEINGCNNEIVLSTSDDGGKTFTGTNTDVRKMPLATGEGRQASTDQYLPALSFTDRGTLVLSYLDRQYGQASTTGGADVSLSIMKDISKPRIKRVTTSTMPVPSQHDLGRYYGDWMRLDVSGSVAHPIWSDTRIPARTLCPWSGKAGKPPRSCHYRANNVQANTQMINTARIPVR